MKSCLIAIALSFCVNLSAQQIADTSYNPTIENPAYEKGNGSVIYIDGGHHNFHKKEGRYKAFSNLLERDGYRVVSYDQQFDKMELAKGEILVISNALHESTVGNWHLPNPSAFTGEEISVIQNWVRAGGSLFLIADHMPLAGAATDLAAAFGFEFTNGFVFGPDRSSDAFFSLNDKSLNQNVITRGRNSSEVVSQVMTFTGQAFTIPYDATPILTFGEGFINLLPDTAWVFNEQTKRMDPKGLSQGAFSRYGKGRVVMFGEAAMFSAQIAGSEKYRMGMNNEKAGENHQLLLNIIHWLDGQLD